MTDSYPPLPDPLPENIHSVQPGGGKCYEIELAWGRLRRWYLKTFRRGYVERMAVLRLGDVAGAPHDILDPRDLKSCCWGRTRRWKRQRLRLDRRLADVSSEPRRNCAENTAMESLRQGPLNAPQAV